MSLDTLKIITNTNPYVFELDCNGNPALTKKNFEFVKVLIENDSNYRSPDIATYKDLLKIGIPKTYENIFYVVKNIDKYDSTHLSSEGTGFGGRNQGKEITTRKIEELVTSLDLENLLFSGSAKPIHIIANAVNESHYRTDGIEKGRYNISFATKYCAYISRDALGKDNYCIYDSVVGGILPYYAKIYCDELIKAVSIRNENDYYEYRNLIDKIINSAASITGYHASYKEFDSLLWYYFKGEDSRIKKALNSIGGV